MMLAYCRRTGTQKLPQGIESNQPAFHPGDSLPREISKATDKPILKITGILFGDNIRKTPYFSAFVSQ